MIHGFHGNTYDTLILNFQNYLFVLLFIVILISKQSRVLYQLKYNFIERLNFYLNEK